MGFKSTEAQLLSAPPYVIGAITSVLLTYLSDKQQRRAKCESSTLAEKAVYLCQTINLTLHTADIIISMICMFIGHVVMLALQGNYTGDRLAVGYIFVILAGVGFFGGVAIIPAWVIANTAPAGRRAISTAFLLTCANVGGFVGSYMYLDREAPSYPTGFGLGTALSMAGFVDVVILWWVLKKRNIKHAQLSEEDIRMQYGLENLVKLGNRSPFFKFQL